MVERDSVERKHLESMPWLDAEYRVLVSRVQAQEHHAKPTKIHPIGFPISALSSSPIKHSFGSLKHSGDSIEQSQ